MTPPIALTIAGSDSSAGAGVQADLKTFAALGVFGASAITAVTVQNTVEVRDVHTVPTGVVVAQVDAVLDDLDVRAVKTGMLATTAIVGAVAELARRRRLPELVVDPVMVSSTGARLLEPAAERAYVESLLPLARVLTPNLREAGVLVGSELRTLADQREAAAALAEAGPEVVVVTGGDAIGVEGDDATDVVALDGRLVELRAERLRTPHTHGSGCSFAAAVAAGLARGAAPLDAIRAAKDFVHGAVHGSAGWAIGAGHGPLDHFGWNEERP